MKNFAITGGAGFIGNYLSEYLCKLGYSVTIIDNLCKKNETGGFVNLNNDLEFEKIDIRDYKKLEKSLFNVDGVFHQAGLISVSESFSNKQDYHSVNVTGTENVLKISKIYGLKVVFASSASVYGEPHFLPVTEESKKIPTNPYGQTKLEAELAAQNYAKTGLEVIGLRYFNVYGNKRQSIPCSGVIERFINKIKSKQSPVVYGDGNQTRDFVYVSDVAEANLKAMLSNVRFGIFNVGSGCSLSIKSLLNMMQKTFDLSSPIVPIFKPKKKFDVRYNEASIELIKRHLNWEPKVSLRDGLIKLSNVQK